MSYATSLLMAYPPPYGPSTLLSDDLVQRSSFPTYYEPPSAPYRSSSRLLSDNFIYHPTTYAPTTYRSSTFQNFPSNTEWQRDIPSYTSYASMNNVREYSDSMVTASNVNTTTSIVHPIDENTFPDHQQNYNRFPIDTDRKIWTPKHSAHGDKPTATYRSLPALSAGKHSKKSPFEEEIQQEPSADVRVGLSESKKSSPIVEENTPEQVAWTDKIDQLHTTQAQREKEKTKALRALPTITKKIEPKSSPVKENKDLVPSYQNRNETYFDSLFDGNYYRKSSNNQQKLNSSYQQSLSSRNQSTGDSPDKPKTKIFPRYAAPSKAPRYEPPSPRRAKPTITTTTWKKQAAQNQNTNDSVTPRESIPKDSDERFREALQKIRSERAEQQNRELPESTAKRLDYGNYVRRSTREGSLLNIIKPSPWTDFMEMKKGHVYSLNKEEKKDLYNQSKSYGERVRNRNFALHQGSETARTQQRFIPIPMENEEPQSDDETSHTPVKNDDDYDSKSFKRSTSASTFKTSSKTFPKPIKTTDQSNSSSASSADPVTSDFESSRKEKKRIHDSSVQTTTVTEVSDNDETTDQHSPLLKTRDSDDDLFTVREEKTLESFEGARWKKR